MKYAIAALLLATACHDYPRTPSPAQGTRDMQSGEVTRDYDGNAFTVYHDTRRAVTCWVSFGVYERAISCIPDQSLAKAGP